MPEFLLLLCDLYDNTVLNIFDSRSSYNDLVMWVECYNSEILDFLEQLHCRSTRNISEITQLEKNIL